MKKGFTLIEVLVSLFIFTLVILAAYKIYDHSQKTYILGEQLTDTQQSTRFAFEKVSLDLRTAGYRVYPDTDALRPDLPVEGMWSGAIAVRADFDRAEELALECTKDATTNECQANTGQYQLVTTGSRDIRVFVLAKKAGEAVDGSDETLVFKADLSVPRDGIIGDLSTLETVTIPGISLAQDKPPYKLYMVSFLPEDSDDPPYSVSDGGDVPANHLVWTPIADGIFSMHFDYYNQNGIADANLMAYDDADISNPSDLVLFRRTHGWPFGGSASGGGNTVRNAVVRIIGMTARPDGQYTDPQINNASLSTEEIAARTLTKMYRKYELTTTINMLNVGVAPHELADTNPPDDPTQLDAVVGYCGGALLEPLPGAGHGHLLDPGHRLRPVEHLGRGLEVQLRRRPQYLRRHLQPRGLRRPREGGFLHPQTHQRRHLPGPRFRPGQRGQLLPQPHQRDRVHRGPEPPQAPGGGSGGGRLS